MRVMIDTNVLLSALVFRSANSVASICIASQGDNTLLISTFVIDEAREVVSRKWPDRSDVLERFLIELSFETVSTPAVMDSGLFEIRDPQDYPVVYSALIGFADILVTGDKDFEDVVAGDAEILTPAQFVQKYSRR